eukprot:619102-Prorocentrum_minimum.AAC.1
MVSMIIPGTDELLVSYKARAPLLEEVTEVAKGLYNNGVAAFEVSAEGWNQTIDLVVEETQRHVDQLLRAYNWSAIKDLAGIPGERQPRVG